MNNLSTHKQVGIIDKIHAEFDRTKGLTHDSRSSHIVIFHAGWVAHKNLMPIYKQCPDCHGRKYIQSKNLNEEPYDYNHDNSDICGKCDGTGEVPIFYTPEQYKEITGKDWPDDAPVWIHKKINNKYRNQRWFLRILKEFNYDIKDYYIIIANEAGKPPSNYRPEE